MEFSSGSFGYCYDLLLEIFSHCSLKVVDKSKMISKVCNDIMYEPLFIKYHKMKTNTIYGYIIQSLYHNKHFSYFISPDDVISTVTLDFLPKESEILASSDQGILCCITRENGWSKQRFYVCKPTTRQIQMLPNPKLRYMTDGVAMVVMQSTPLRYKIFRLCRIPNRLWSNHNTYLCEIFDSKIWAWKQYEILLPHLVFFGRHSLYVNGKLHWLLSDYQILAFDVESTTYTIFTLPAVVIGKEDIFPKEIELIKYKGKLGLICRIFDNDFSIWELEDYKNHVWKRIKKISGEGVTKKRLPHAVGLYSTDMALLEGYDYMFYNFEESSVNVVNLDHHFTNPSDVFPFRSDSELVNLRG